MSYEWSAVMLAVNKSSMALELSEAINSMYCWYQNASECYAYSNDVTWVQNGTRGWTLQELLAPKWVFFFDRNWNPIGQKSSNSVKVSELVTEISSITEIDDEYIKKYRVQSACAAMKMSWYQGGKRAEARIWRTAC